MRLKSLQLIGFKSFVDRTEFNLEKGITCIVGPNGSGKSNIVDAIKWGLGEMRPKSLRGGDMEDVIFNGSETRKLSGMAEVSLTFVADGKGMPAGYADYNEIMITRRVFRTGESEYFINKVPVRWRDVIDLFLDTGIGPRAYSIIEQGVVEKIIMAKPEDRRLFFEEVAGISKYRMRKKEALADMEATQQNLQRVDDILSELKRQLNSLDRQAKKAEKYRELMKELRENEFKLAFLQFRKMQEEFNSLGKEIQELKDKEILLTSELSELQSKHEVAKITVAEAEKKFNEVSKNYYEKQSKIQKIDNDINLLKRDLVNAELNKKNLLTELDELIVEKEKLEGEYQSFKQSLEELRGSLNQKEAEELEVASFYNSELERISVLRKELENTRDKITDEKANELRIRNELVAIQKDIDDRSRRIERLNSEIMELKQLAGTKEAEFKRMSNVQNQLQREREELQGSIDQMKSQLEELTKNLDIHSIELQNLTEEIMRLKSRYNTRKEMLENYEEFAAGVRSIMERQKATGGVLRYRTIADIINVEEKYIAALEAVLGEKIQYIAVHNQEAGFDAIEYLKEKNSGRATFVSSLMSGKEKMLGPLPEEPGIYPLMRVVKCTDGYEGIIQRILRDIYIVEDFNRAKELWYREGNTFILVTLDGDVFYPEGIFSGGSREPLEGGILAHKEEIFKLENGIRQKQELISLLKTDIDSLSRKIDEYRKALERNNDLLKEKEIALVNTENEINSMRKGLEGYLKIAEAKVAEKSILEAELKQFSVNQIEKLKSLEANEKLTTGLISTLKMMEDQNRELELNLTRLSEKLMIVKAEVASMREKVNSTDSFCVSIAQRLGGVENRISDKRKEIDALDKFIDDSEKNLDSQEQDLKKALEDNIILEKMMKDSREEYDKLVTDIRHLESQLEEKRRIHGELRDRLAKLNISFSEQRVSLDFLRSTIQEKFQKDIDEFKDLVVKESMEELDTKVNELQARVNSMGEINLVAAEEYRELSERFDFLTNQREDILKSLNNLKEAINKINKTSRDKFIETFRAINEKFKVVFPKFFDGGRAELYLTNEHEVLESGIEIFAQPPGKKLQNISLLSGGEKALTGLSLIFSFFLNKPSPFCILDEADAPLDESNLRKFLSMVKEMSKEIQFILITHNKLSMEISDTLYGITMEEPGVSSVISVKLN